MKGNWALAFIAVIGSSEVRAGSPAVEIYDVYQFRTAHIETEGLLFNGNIEVGAGSGFLLSSKFVLTVEHIIPPEVNFEKSEVRVRLGSRKAMTLKVTKVHRDQTNDLALLELDTASSGSRCPFPVATDPPSKIPPGSRLIALGYPIDKDLSIIDGTLSSKTASEWQTSLPINPGNSGGPIFDEDKRLLAVARKGTFRWIGGKFEFAKTDKGVPVVGINYLIPIGLLFEGPLKSVLEADKNWSDCLKVNSGVAVTSLSLPKEINRSFSFSKTKADHPHLLKKHTEPFVQDYQTEPGYRIRSCQLVAMSAAGHDDVVCNVIDSGNKARLSGKLTSGPVLDQTRGWWTGEVVLTEINREFDEVIGGTP